MNAPCKRYLLGRPNHLRQKVVVIRGARWQICEACGTKMRRIPKITPEELEALQAPEHRKAG
jgi:hypothetical protein